MRPCYKKLFKMLIDRDISRKQIKVDLKLSGNTFTKLVNSKYVSMEILARICEYLNADIGDIMSFEKE